MFLHEDFLHLFVSFVFFFSSRRRHTRCLSDWSSDVCSSDLMDLFVTLRAFDANGAEVTFKGANDPQVPVSQGWLRVSQRKLDARSKPYRPFHPDRKSVV